MTGLWAGRLSGRVWIDTHSACCSVGTGITRPGSETDHSAVLVTGLIDGVTTPVCSTLHDVHGENFTFTVQGYSM